MDVDRSHRSRRLARFAPLALVVLAGLAGLPPRETIAQPVNLDSIPPELIQQLSQLPPERQRQLAQQYGIDIDSVLGGGGLGGGLESTLGRPGTPITPPLNLDDGEPSITGQDSSFTLPELFLDFEEERERRERKRAYLEALKNGADRAATTIEPADPAFRYGLDLFRGEVSSFAPVDTAPVPPDYRLGPGDSINVLLTGKENQELTVEVDREGMIAIPRLGRLSVAGLSFEDAKSAVRERVSTQLIGVDSTVGVGRLRAINVFLAGEVRVPGNRSMSALSKVTHALFAGGGLTDIGSLRGIEVRRGGTRIATFDAYDLLLRGDATGDVRLQDGDVVFVPPVRAMATAVGAVRRPAVYEVEPKETVADLLRMAGGVTERGLETEALIDREGGARGAFIVRLDLSAEADLARSLKAGDRLRVFRSTARFADRVVLRGAVERPGVFGYIDGLRVSDLIGDPATDLLEETDYDYALIVSVEARTNAISVRQFDLADAIQRPRTSADPLLAPRDEILIFNDVAVATGDLRAQQRAVAAEQRRAAEREQLATQIDEVRRENAPSAEAGESADGEQRTQDIETAIETGSVERGPNRRLLLDPVVERLKAQARPGEPVQVFSVTGAVNSPGEYPLVEGQTVGMALTAAGGADARAFLSESELRRFVVNADAIGSVRSIELDLSGQGPDLGVAVAGRDQLSIKATPNWSLAKTVNIAGEVRFPGSYSIAPGESLGDLIERAGGLTPDGFADGSVFTRALLREKEQRELRRFVEEVRRNAASTTLTAETDVPSLAGVELIAQTLLESESLGRLIVDVPRILRGDPAADILLQDGDRFAVPAKNDSVSVIGEVLRSGSYRFQEGLDIDDYLALSAGTTRKADEGRMYVVRANGSIRRVEGVSWLRFDLDGSDIRPGDTIVVPIDQTYRNPLDYFSTIVGIAYQSGIALAALLAIENR